MASRAGRRVGAVATCLALAAVAACGGSEEDRADEGDEPRTEANQAAPTEEGDADTGGTLRVGLPSEVDGMNPASNRWSLAGNLQGSAVFDPLMTFDEDRNLVPFLAESVEANDDGTVWTIELPSGVLFHDGTELDAEAVRMNIQMRKDNPLTGGALEPVETVEAVDADTVVVTMSTPWFGYAHTLAAQGGYMAAPSQLESDNASARAVGTGPFVQTEDYSQGLPLLVERFDDYWGDPAHLDAIEFQAVIDPDSRAQALDSGDLDLIITEDPQTITDFRTTGGIVQVEDVAAEESFVMLNHARPPFDDPLARETLAKATDVAALIDLLGADVWIPATGPYTDAEAYAAEDDGYPVFDAAEAAAAIEAYEAETGGPLSFTLSASSGQQQNLAEAVAAQWLDVGIDVSVAPLAETTYLTNMFVGDFQAGMFRNFGYVNPDSNYIFWHSSQAKGLGNGSINFGQVINPALDDLLDEARATPDDAARTELYRQITPVLNEAIPYIWLFHVNWALAAQERVGGLTLPRELGFARQDAKPWWNKLWLEQD